MPYSAGMLSYASYFTIPPRKKQHYVLNHCCYRGFQPLKSFAVRVHTHTMGKRVFMNRAPAGRVGEHVLAALAGKQLQCSCQHCYGTGIQYCIASINTTESDFVVYCTLPYVTDEPVVQMSYRKQLFCMHST